MRRRQAVAAPALRDSVRALVDDIPERPAPEGGIGPWGPAGLSREVRDDLVRVYRRGEETPARSLALLEGFAAGRISDAELAGPDLPRVEIPSRDGRPRRPRRRTWWRRTCSTPGWRSCCTTWPSRCLPSGSSWGGVPRRHSWAGSHGGCGGARRQAAGGLRAGSACPARSECPIDATASQLIACSAASVCGWRRLTAPGADAVWAGIVRNLERLRSEAERARRGEVVEATVDRVIAETSRRLAGLRPNEVTAQTWARIAAPGGVELTGQTGRRGGAEPLRVWRLCRSPGRYRRPCCARRTVPARTGRRRAWRRAPGAGCWRPTDRIRRRRLRLSLRCRSSLQDGRPSRSC